ncbi:MAG: hypothetical protein ACT452_14550 [Microthrixaceae bacterium]
MSAPRVPVDAGDPALVAAAAANNAAWCDAVCRTHGLGPTTADDAWTSAARTPPLYPDAVTLAPSPSIPDLLARIDASAGCSIKDSFGSLDLAPFGFEVLFDATWIVRRPGAEPAGSAEQGWTVVDDTDGFECWEQAWRGEDDSAPVLQPDLLDDRSVAVVALAPGGGERVVAGAILNEAAGVVGVSNVFVTSAAGRGAWGGCIAIAERRFPGATLVGYESGPALEVACAQGFHPVGPLRVWLRATDAPS